MLEREDYADKIALKQQPAKTVGITLIVVGPIRHSPAGLHLRGPDADGQLGLTRSPRTDSVAARPPEALGAVGRF
jgi:hypothetical protein